MKHSSLFVLFCLYLWDPPNWDASDCLLGLFRKHLRRRRRGTSAWFHGVFGLVMESPWVLNEFFTEMYTFEAFKSPMDIFKTPWTCVCNNLQIYITEGGSFLNNNQTSSFSVMGHFKGQSCYMYMLNMRKSILVSSIMITSARCRMQPFLICETFCEVVNCFSRWRNSSVFF